MRAGSLFHRHFDDIHNSLKLYTHTYIYIYNIYLFIYMVIDPKVLVKAFNCEDRSCYVGNPRENFFRARESNIFIRESFAKVGK